MNKERAVQILMLSPLYFRIGLMERCLLVKEFCRIYSSAPVRVRTEDHPV